MNLRAIIAFSCLALMTVADGFQISTRPTPVKFSKSVRKNVRRNLALAMFRRNFNRKYKLIKCVQLGTCA